MYGLMPYHNFYEVIVGEKKLSIMSIKIVYYLRRMIMKSLRLRMGNMKYGEILKIWWKILSVVY